MIPVNEPLLDGNELKYLTECIQTGWISSEGPFVQRLEREFANVVNRKYGIAVSNGTAALQLAIEALSLEPGDEVIIPTFTIISCASCLARLGLKPVPVECDPATMNSEAHHFEAAITDRTRAIMVVHIYGLPVDMTPILEFAKKYNLKIIEDAAEAIGQTYNGLPCGSFGDVSVVSFYPNKHITTGEGGMVLSNDETIIERAANLRNLAFIPPRRFVHQEFGWNYRMTNLQAAVGVAQLERLSRNVAIKRQIGLRYNTALADLNGVTLPIPKTSYAENIYWVYTVVLDKECPVDAAYVINELGKRGIGTRPFFWPMHEQPVLRRMFPEYEELSMPVAEHLARNGFYLPSGLGLQLDRIDEVGEAVHDVIREL
jgi:perosamine synthetase